MCLVILISTFQTGKEWKQNRLVQSYTSLYISIFILSKLRTFIDGFCPIATKLAFSKQRSIEGVFRETIAFLNVFFTVTC